MCVSAKSCFLFIFISYGSFFFSIYVCQRRAARDKSAGTHSLGQRFLCCSSPALFGREKNLRRDAPLIRWPFSQTLEYFTEQKLAVLKSLNLFIL